MATPRNAEIVTNFRNVVERVIDEQAERAKAENHAWPDVDKIAAIGGITFMKLGPEDGGLTLLRSDKERTWVASTNYSMRRQRIGTVALISLASKPDSLVRHWSFESSKGSGLFAITSDKLLTRKADLRAALDWINSPHLHPDALRGLATLSEDEHERVSKELQQDAAEAAETQAGLERLRQIHNPGLRRPLDFRPRIR